MQTWDSRLLPHLEISRFGISDLADIISKSGNTPSFLAEGVALLRPTDFYAAVPMDVSYLLDSLNDKQREAVAAPRSNLLVLAGAGSGKMRTGASYRGHERGKLLAILDYGGDVYQQSGGGDASSYRATDGHQPGRHVGRHLPRAGAPPAACAPYGRQFLPQDFQILDSEDQLRLVSV